MGDPRTVPAACSAEEAAFQRLHTGPSADPAVDPQSSSAQAAAWRGANPAFSMAVDPDDFPEPHMEARGGLPCCVGVDQPGVGLVHAANCPNRAVAERVVDELLDGPVPRGLGDPGFLDAWDRCSGDVPDLSDLGSSVLGIAFGISVQAERDLVMLVRLVRTASRVFCSVWTAVSAEFLAAIVSSASNFAGGNCWLGYDAYEAYNFVSFLRVATVGLCHVPQTRRHLSSSCHALEAMVHGGSIVHGGDQQLRACLAATEFSYDANENLAPTFLTALKGNALSALLNALAAKFDAKVNAKISLDRGWSYRVGEVPPALREAVSGIEFTGTPSDKEAANSVTVEGFTYFDPRVVAAVKATSGVPIEILQQVAEGEAGFVLPKQSFKDFAAFREAWEASRSAGAETSTSRDGLLGQLLFAARALAQRNMTSLDYSSSGIMAGGGRRIAFCQECLVEERLGIQEHTPGCHTGRVFKLLDKLHAAPATATNDSKSSEKEKAPEGETAGADDGIRARGLAERVCLKCGSRAGVWIAEVKPETDWMLQNLALNQWARAAAGGYVLYTHQCASLAHRGINALFDCGGLVDDKGGAA